ncbi:MAG: F0F1 ATP synthase subunit A [bacterium]|nr:F0F1 ATP synthase subunit A [bacterium]
MHRLKVERVALLALLLGAALLAPGYALAADEHGHSAPATATATEQHEAAPADAHQASPAEAPATDHAHGEPAEAGHAATEHPATDGHAVDAAHGTTDAHGADATHGDAAAHGGGHGGGMPHLPSAITFISKWVPQPVGDKLNALKDPIFSLFMAAIIAAFFISLSGKLNARHPGRAQMAAEMIFGGLYSLFATIIGSTARRYTPFLGSMFVFILCNNLFGLIPLGHSSTSSFANTTFALGMMTFLYVQGIALKENGIGGYLHHMAGSPKTKMDWGFSLLLFPLHLLGELIKPVSLSLRLFGNIFGEDTLVATMVLLGAGISFSLSGQNPWVPGLPLQFPFYFLGLLSCTIQALVFTLLATVYIALWLPHGHHGDEHGEGHHAH